MTTNFPDVTLQVHQIRTDLQNIERMVHELAARLDSAFPGADVNRHHSEHSDSQQRAVQRKQFWSDIWAKLMFGTAVGGAVLVGLVLISYLRPAVLP